MHIDERKQVSRKAGNEEDMSAVKVLPGADRRETADLYRGVVLDLGRYRVAVCRDGLQWLYQRHRPGFAGVGTAWDTLGHCVTRAALIRLHRAHSGAEAPGIDALPHRIPQENRR